MYNSKILISKKEKRIKLLRSLKITQIQEENADNKERRKNCRTRKQNQTRKLKQKKNNSLRNINIIDNFEEILIGTNKLFGMKKLV